MWWWFLAISGVERKSCVVIFVAAIFFWLGTRLNFGQISVGSSCNKYGIRIVSPIPTSNVSQFLRVSGTYQEIPKDGALWIWAAYAGKSGTEYRPKNPVILNQQKQAWYSDVDYLADVGSPIEIKAMLVGQDGEILTDYHIQVGQETKQWFSFNRLPSDVIECDSVKVTVTQP